MTLEKHVEWFKERIDVIDINVLEKYIRLKGFRRYQQAYYLLKRYRSDITDKDIGEVFKYEIRLRANITYYITLYSLFNTSVTILLSMK